MCQINLSCPSSSERVRGFQPPWHTVWIYKCKARNHVVRVKANSFRGKTPVPSVGAIMCPQCEFEAKYPPKTDTGN